MSKLARVVFRLDFKKRCTAYIDAPGAAIDLLDSSPDEFWDHFGENVGKRSLKAEFSNSGETYREINFAPTDINGTIEYTTGIELASIHRDRAFLEMARITHEFQKKFDAWSVARAGIRFFILSSVEIRAKENMQEKFQELIKGPVCEAVTGNLGQMSDLSFLFEGKGEDGIDYRIQLGPHAEKDNETLLFPKGKTDDPEFFLKENYNLLCDVDLWEKDISFREHTLDKWSRTKLKKAIAAVNALSAGIVA